MKNNKYRYNEFVFLSIIKGASCRSYKKKHRQVQYQ